MRFIFILLLLPFSLFASVKSTTGTIKFDVNNDASEEMVLNSTGLGIGLTPTANLHINGNAVISDDLFIGTATGASNLNINGSIGFNIEMVSSDTTLSGNSTVFVDTSSSNISLLLPSASSVTGRSYFIKKTDNSNDLWIYSDNNIDDESILNLTTESTGYSFVSVMSNGSQWFITNLSSNTSFVDFIDQDLVLWLDADDLDGDGAAEALSEGNIVSGNQVNYWVDKSTTSSNLSQATAGEQPILIPASQNSRAGVYFDGADDFMKITGINQTSTDMHVFLTYKVISGSSNDTIIGADNDRGNIRLVGSTAFRNPGVNTDANDLANADGQSRIDGSDGISFTLNNAHIYSLTRGSTVNSSPYSDLAIGRANSALGRNPEFELYEVLIYKRVLSDTERNIVESYLSSKWGTP